MVSIVINHLMTIFYSTTHASVSSQTVGSPKLAAAACTPCTMRTRLFLVRTIGPKSQPHMYIMYRTSAEQCSHVNQATFSPAPGSRSAVHIQLRASAGEAI